MTAGRQCNLPLCLTLSVDKEVAAYFMPMTLFFCYILLVLSELCWTFVTNLPPILKFNSSKSVVLRIGPWFDVTSAPLLSGCELKFVTSVKYFGACLVADKCFRCNVEHIKMKFYRVFNAIYIFTRKPS